MDYGKACTAKNPQRAGVIMPGKINQVHDGIRLCAEG